MQTKLFAALNESGKVRFVDEVDRGAACGCFCPVCASPLIAKQGTLKEWHFAHEASQERVECEVGALNMLRRFTAEMLHRNPLPTLPLYTQEVTAKSPLCWNIRATESASWPAGIEPEGLKWELGGTQSKPFLSGMLTTGVPFDAFIIIKDQRPSSPPPSDQGIAHLIFWIVTPTHADLIKRVNLEQHINHHGRWMWESHPEYCGHIAAAREKAHQKVEAEYSAKLARVARLDEAQKKAREAREARLLAQNKAREVSEARKASRLEDWKKRLAKAHDSFFHAHERGQVEFVKSEFQGEGVERADYDDSDYIGDSHAALHRSVLARQAIEQTESNRQQADWATQKPKKDANVKSAPWAPQRKPHSSFILYKLKHSQGTWVIYTRIDESIWMVPLPEFDGWDESMPPSLGTTETGTVAYRLHNLASAMMYLAPISEQVKNTSSIDEIERWAGLSQFGR